MQNSVTYLAGMDDLHVSCEHLVALGHITLHMHLVRAYPIFRDVNVQTVKSVPNSVISNKVYINEKRKTKINKTKFLLPIANVVKYLDKLI